MTDEKLKMHLIGTFLVTWGWAAARFFDADFARAGLALLVWFCWAAIVLLVRFVVPSFLGRSQP